MKSKRAREAEAAVPVEDVPSHDVPAKKRKRSDDDQEHDVKKSKKDKKDKHKKESRRERKDKRRDLQDLPEQEEEEQQEQEEAMAAEKSVPMTGADADSEQPDAAGEPNEKKAKKDKKKKKEKRDKEGKEETKEEKKDKKDKKKKKEKKDKKAKAESNDAATTPNESNTTTAAATPENVDNDDDDTANKKKDRHIVFVGNLPFSATVASITAHFSSLSPIAVRCLRNRDDPNPCRGIAFVEFAQVWHMRTCLDKFHHSLFDDGVSPARRINVELTAGGGGKTKQRTQKIREKNHKLNENRAKRIEREKTAKAATVDAAPADGAPMEDAIHPSRRARVPGNNKY